MKRLLSAIMVLSLLASLLPTMLIASGEEDLYARQVTNIPYYSNGQIKFSQTEFGKTFVFTGETNYDAGGVNRMKRLTASNQDEIWRLMLEPAYLFTGWNFNATTEQYTNGEIYAQLDLGGSTPIDEVTVSYLPAANEKNDSDYSISKVPKIYRFDVSDDGVDYRTVKTVTTDLSSYKDTITTKEAYVQAVTTDPEMYDLMHTHRVIFDETINCRYIRFVMIQPTQDWVYNDGTGDKSSTISDWQLFTYNTWKDQENESNVSIAPKDANGIYQFANNGSDRNIIGFVGEENLSSKGASRVTYKDETISRDWNLDEGAIQSANGNFALATGDYSNYTNENVYLQYDFGYPERVDVIEQYFRNTEDTTKVNDIPKTVRIDYANKNERGITEWIEGESFTIDMSDPASVGEKKAAAYNNYIANGTSTNGEKMFLNQPVRFELTAPIEARFIRIVYLQPTQNGSLPTDNKLKIKKTIIKDLGGIADTNKLAEGSTVPFNEDGSVKFVNVTDNNIRYEGETNEDYPVSRFKASSYVSGQDWHFRHLLTKDSTELGVKATPANYANENIWVEYDFGDKIDIDSLVVEFRAYSNNSSERTRYAEKAKYYNAVPATVRIDYGNLDASNKIVWTEGNIVANDLAEYDILSNYSESEILAAYDTPQEERTPDQTAIVNAVNTLPTGATYNLGYENVRFLRYVIIDPLQSGIENYTSSSLTWYLRYSCVYGSPAAQQEDITSAEITSVSENTINYTVTLSENDEQAVIFAASYAGNDLIAVRKISAADTSAAIETAGADMVKIFVWDSIERIKPLAKAEYPLQ